MNQRWSATKLNDVLTERRETPSDEDLISGRVRIIEKISFDSGRIQLRVGGATKTGMILVRPGDLVVSGINAAKGAIAIYDVNQTAPVAATIHYGAYEVNRERAHVRFLWWMLRSNFFQDLLFEYVPGGIKTELKAKRLLPVPVPLPPLAEQRRVVARIDELAGQINEARTLRQQAAEEADAMLVAMAHRGDLNPEAKQQAGWHRRQLREVVTLVDDACSVEPNRSYPNLGIYSFGRGLFHKPPIDGVATSAKSLRRVKAGQFIYSRLFAFEGAYGMVNPEFDGAYVSQEYPTFDCDPRFVRAEFLAAYFKPRHIWTAIAEGSKGLGDRRQRVQPPQILSHELWLPPIEWQNRIAEMQAEVDALKRMQAETAAELDALLPSILDKAFKGEL